MTDAIIIREAEALGYEIFWSCGAAIFRRCAVMGPRPPSPPFETLDDAAYAAISDHETLNARLRDA